MVLRGLLDVRRVQKNLKKDSRELETLQNEKLRAIIKHAYDNVPFYHRKLDAANIKPNDVKSVSDLVKLPVTAKSEIKAASTTDVLARNIDANRIKKRYTSGSTGIPLAIFLDNITSNLEGAVLKRTLFEDGLRIRDKMAVLTDLQQNPQEDASWIQRFGFMKRKSISIFEDIEKQISVIEEYGPDVLRGYSSAVTDVAEYCNRNSVALHPRLIFTGAEILSNESRKRIDSVFDAELFDLYGSMELGHMAWECQRHAGYHINADSVVMEFLNKGESVASGESGEIVCTNLINYAMPLIRYETGDVGTSVNEKCSCGRAFPLMKVIEGRKDDYLFTLDGQVISPFIFFPYPFENIEAIRQFRIIQEKRNLLTIQLVVEGSFLKDSQTLTKARNEIRRVFGEGMDVEFQMLDKIPRDPSGKFRMVVSKMPSIPTDFSLSKRDQSAIAC